MRTDEELKSTILVMAGDAMSDFLYYDRKGCEILKVEEIEDAIRDGVVSVEEIVEVFRSELLKAL